MSQDSIFRPKNYTSTASSGRFEWSAPSNIALVKYWGKKDGQIPANASVSFTLNACKTVTSVGFEKRQNDGNFSFDLLFEGEPKPDFRPKIEKFFERIFEFLPFLKDFHFSIDTRNTFPHSSGIASSASGMAALAVNLMSIERLLDPDMADDYFWKKASFLARLGSGSACRSVKGEVVVWGDHAEIPGSSDLFGVEFPFGLHENFRNYRDTILLVEKGQKEVSSSAGHNLMFGNPFSQARFEQARKHLSEMTQVLQNGDLEKFIEITESEALSLHAVMMTSRPYYILMKPNTLEIIERIWKFRRETKIPVCFTLDAGANVHVLYPERWAEAVSAFVKSALGKFCKNGEFIEDGVGAGAVELTIDS